jgi:NRAMP (natural resistance-associated macrophage protein)-like metal ion transporter
VSDTKKAQTNPAEASEAERPPGRPMRTARHRFGKRAWFASVAGVLAFLGPGLISANAGNEAGSIATYASVGARYGYDLLWLMVLITVALILVQEMAARTGVVSGKGLAELIREHYGVRWSALAMLTVLLANLAITVSEFLGIGVASELLGVSRLVAVPLAAALIWLILVRGSYRIAERIFIAFTVIFFAYPVAAILAHPHWGAIVHRTLLPHFHFTSQYVLLVGAVVGATITPFMQLYLQSAVSERGVPPDELGRERFDVATGAIFANLVAAFVIIATAAALHEHGVTKVSSAADAAKALQPFAGRYAKELFAVGLLGSSLLAAAILPVTIAYVLTESFGMEKGIGHRFREAPAFVGTITVLISISAAVALIPNLPVISFLVGIQDLNGVLLPVTLFFLWRISSSSELMGRWRNGRLFNALAALIVAAVSALSLLLIVVAIGRVFGM